jgi:hypothetical protein
MMYLRQEDLGPSNQHIRDFIEWSIPESGTPANYGRRTPVAAGEGQEGEARPAGAGGEE